MLHSFKNYNTYATCFKELYNLRYILLRIETLTLHSLKSYNTNATFFKELKHLRYIL